MVALAQLQAMIASYWGHFFHANSVRLWRVLFSRFNWLPALFTLTVAGGLQPRWIMAAQTGWLRHGIRPREIGFWFLPIK